MQQTPDQEERTLAALAHLGSFANGLNLLGIIGATLIWTSRRQRSAFIAEHALQALTYQVTGALVLLGLMTIWGGCLVVSLIPMMIRPALYASAPPPSFLIALALGLIVPLVGLLLAGYSLHAAWQAWHGHPFHYAGMNWLHDQSREQVTPASTPAETPNVALVAQPATTKA